MQCPFYSRVADEDEKGRFSEIGNFFFWQLGKPKKKPKSERGVATPCSLRTTPSLTDLLVSTSGAESDTFLNQPRPPPTTRLTPTSTTSSSPWTCFWWSGVTRWPSSWTRRRTRLFWNWNEWLRASRRNLPPNRGCTTRMKWWESLWWSNLFDFCSV